MMYYTTLVLALLFSQVLALPQAGSVPPLSVTPASTPVSTPVSTPASTPVSTPSSAHVSTPLSTPVSTPSSTPVSTPSSTPVSTPSSTPISTPASTPVTPAPPPSTTVTTCTGTFSPAAPVPTPLRATFDKIFDKKDGSLDTVACSNGNNGLAAKFPTFGDLPTFPNIGGAFDIVWDSPNCGGCWSIVNPATGATIFFTGIDTSGAGFNLAFEAFQNLGGDANAGVLGVNATKVDASKCGL